MKASVAIFEEKWYVLTYAKEWKRLIMKNVAIIIVNWNGKQYLKDCLDSIETQSYKDFDIILVDNNSSDNSLEAAKEYKNIVVIRNDSNYGFAKGNNIGIEKAIADGYKHVVLVNYDTRVDPNWLEYLIKRAEKDPLIGAVQSKILLADCQLINTTGGHLHYLGFSYCGDYRCEDTFIKAADIPLASGASVLFKTSALEKSGLFDESFFMYHEDTDLSWRLQELGYKVVFEPKSVIYHEYSFSKNKNKFYHSEKNRIIFVLKNYQLKTIILLLPAFLATELLMMGYSAFDGWFGQKIKGYKYILGHRKEIMDSRRKIQENRKIKDKELKTYFSYKLSFYEIKSPLFVPLNFFFWFYWTLVRVFI